MALLARRNCSVTAARLQLNAALTLSPPRPFAQGSHALALTRTVFWDAAASAPASFPVVEYEGLRNETFVDAAAYELVSSGSMATLPIPAAAGATLDLLVDFALPAGGDGSFSGVGIAVRAPPNTPGDSYFGLWLAVSAANANGVRTVDIGSNIGDHRNAGNTTSMFAGESALRVRVLVDRPLVESFVMGGRYAWAYSLESELLPFSLANSSVILFNYGPVAVNAIVSAFSMGCGWSDSLPVPKVATAAC
jgi:hypothetical protein